MFQDNTLYKLTYLLNCINVEFYGEQKLGAWCISLVLKNSLLPGDSSPEGVNVNDYTDNFVYRVFLSVTNV